MAPELAADESGDGDNGAVAVTHGEEGGRGEARRQKCTFRQGERNCRKGKAGIGLILLLEDTTK